MMKKKRATKPATKVAPRRLTRGESFPIVGIGASAGGLEAATQLFKDLPADTGMGFVLVQHLDPQHESALAALLSRATKMPVIEARNGMMVQRDHVYVIPPNKKMCIAKRTLRLLPRGNGDGAFPASVDYFFRSLAADLGGQAIGIVLSGTGSDGTLGLEQIKVEGGISFVQSEQSTKYGGMPGSASGCADFILPPAEIAAELARIGQHPRLLAAKTAEIDEKIQPDEDEFRQICGLLRHYSGVDFGHYKPSTLRRRIHRRMMLLRLDTLKDYVSVLRKNQSELESLFEDILIGVTSFFRDPKVFEGLKKKVLPRILANKLPDAAIRVWIAGCSTGEEVYSLAIAITEFMEKEGVRCPLQFFGTDINEAILNRARAGEYAETIADNVSADRLRRFFSKTPTGYRIHKSIRDLCVFARQNVIQDPPFSRVDLISCRNVLIYFGAALQKKVIPVFHYALRPYGFLLLGTAESVGGFADLFGLVDAKVRIYEKKLSHSRIAGVAGFVAREEAQPSAVGGLLPQRHSVEPMLADIRKQADAIVLSQFSPNGVVVNSSMEILQFRGVTGQYLEHAPGEATLSLLKMARQGLAVELRPLISKAAKHKHTVSKEGVQVRHDGWVTSTTIRVVPFQLSSAGDVFFLVLFEEKASAPVAASAKARAASPPPLQRELSQLRDELSATKLSLQSIIEEQDASNEELRAANEEIHSSNEELQSTNEELETAQEELQSTNEELTTLNDELQNRNVELQQVSDDLVNLFGSVDVPVVMLSSDMRIRRFTPRAEKIFNLIPRDVGRPLTDLKIFIPDLPALVTSVLESLSSEQREVRDHDGHWHLLRIRPYKTADHRIDGVVLTLSDIDAVKRSLEEAEHARLFAEAIVATVREPLLVLDHELRVIMANRSFYDLFHVRPAQTEKKLVFELGDGQWDIPALRQLLEEILPAKTTFENFRVEHDFPGVGPKTLLLNARRLATPQDRRNWILLAMQDVSVIAERQKD